MYLIHLFKGPCKKMIQYKYYEMMKLLLHSQNQ